MLKFIPAPVNAHGLQIWEALSDHFRSLCRNPDETIPLVLCINLGPSRIFLLFFTSRYRQRRQRRNHRPALEALLRLCSTARSTGNSLWPAVQKGQENGRIASILVHLLPYQGNAATNSTPVHHQEGALDAWLPVLPSLLTVGQNAAVCRRKRQKVGKKRHFFLNCGGTELRQFRLSRP